MKTRAKSLGGRGVVGLPMTASDVEINVGDQFLPPDGNVTTITEVTASIIRHSESKSAEKRWVFESTVKLGVMKRYC